VRSLFCNRHVGPRLPGGGLAGDRETGGRVVCEVNPEPTPLSDLCDEVLMGKAGEVLPLIGR
jgi:hypothetical protein